MVVIILAFTTDELQGKRNKERHNRESTKKAEESVKKVDTCVSGYCIGPTYNSLELPSTGRQDVKMNLEVCSIIGPHVITMVFPTKNSFILTGARCPPSGRQTILREP